jgi:glycosyltransferase involved in cell wall biosynthesis
MGDVAVLVLSSVFPSCTRPTFGVFVRERVRHVAKSCRVVVVAPVPWSPFNGWVRGLDLADTPRVESQAGMLVYHPRFVSPPALGKCWDGLLYFASLLRFVVRLRRRFPFDLIDAHFSYPDGLAGVLLGRALGRPTLITLRGTHDLRHASYRLRRAQIRFALTTASRIIVVSDSLARAAVSLGVPADRLRVVPNGVDLEKFRPLDREVARRRLGLPTDGRILLTVGHLTGGKGQHRVVGILPRLLERHPDLFYVSVGNDPSGGRYRRWLEDLAVGDGVAHRVRIVPARPHEEIPLWMAAADLFCLATQNEGWCNALTEALACGLPVVTTRVGGNAEMVRDGHNGLLVPFGDDESLGLAITDGLTRAWDRNAVAADGRAYSWDHAAAAVVQEFRDCLSAAAAGGGGRKEAIVA